MMLDQTILHDPEAGTIGNCMQAAIASVLGLTLCDVPHFAAMGDDWSDCIIRWCAARRMTWLPLDADAGEWIPDDMPTLLSGPSPRGVPHLVVGRGMTVVHDPHPSRGGLDEIEQVWLLIPHLAPLEMT